MQSNEHIPGTLDEVVMEIASILANGYMRYRRGRQLALDSNSPATDVAESEVLTEKRLDCSGHLTVRS